MRRTFLLLIHFVFISIIIFACGEESSNDARSIDDIQLAVSKADKSLLMSDDRSILGEKLEQADIGILVNPDTEYQEMEGFGFALTGGSATHLSGMTASARSAILRELFSKDDGAIAMSYIRVTIGASDLDPQPFSYNDLPAGQTDPNLEQFSIDPDRERVIPILKEILAINPDIKIMASPWSAPAWMKSNKSTVGGELLDSFYSSYANYFVKYIQAMAAEGITIHSITVQNEPLHGGNNPSMEMSAAQQNRFIKNNLGPAFQQNNIETEIVLYDHNADRTDYPISILDDSTTKPFVAGSAFHLYGGSINDLMKVKAAHPDKKLYFTEQWYSSVGDFGNDMIYHSEVIFTGGALNWCGVIIEWNLSSNSDFTPHTPGGCTMCKGAISINGDNVERNAGYYAVGHYSAFVEPGAKRVQLTEIPNFGEVAFKNPDGSIVVVLTNIQNTDRTINMTIEGLEFSVMAPSRSIVSIKL